ncbi:nitrogen regulation protein NR(II) [Desulfopila sp. IMCC35008]|uniref:two-component system sensor histidine kinase NtrB n=1 Tax=Desulfopila sp. IMCC35008 TaxID=2653858 RepID=UPI0013D196D5|nr:ATP-binding protein [Desulfopila sp. IMCC35008]
MNGLSLAPAVTVEFVGSALVILLAFVALGYARALIRLEPDNFIWGFLWYFSIALAAFAISRGVGHIIRISLVYSNQRELWTQLSPYSGGFNTMLMISVAAVTIYYHKGLAAYKAIRSEAEKLAEANRQLEASADQLQRLNTNLEGIVEDRTRDLSDSEKKFRNFFENSKDIVYFCDLEGTITNINSSGIRMLGAENNNEQINFHQLFRDPEVLKQYLSEIQSKGYVSDLDMECIGKDGTIRHILLAANASMGADGTMIGYEGIGKDMTRLRTITEQLINHEKMASVGEMAAGVAHEINTPLGIILGYTQLMMDDFAEDSEPYSTMLVIERQTKVCRRIVADLLKFSRQAESQKTSINLNEIIREVLAVTEHTLNINKITIQRRFAEGLPQVTGDAEKLHQVFINLFNNAQYAMADGGDITIITSSATDTVRVSVIDTGTGINETIKNRIFDPFFTTKEVGKGTGLGLSVTYGIIQEHNGTIEVESPVTSNQDGEPRQGTAFHITLPVLTEETEQTAKEQE